MVLLANKQHGDTEQNEKIARKSKGTKNDIRVPPVAHNMLASSCYFFEKQGLLVTDGEVDLASNGSGCRHTSLGLTLALAINLRCILLQIVSKCRIGRQKRKLWFLALVDQVCHQKT